MCKGPSLPQLASLGSSCASTDELCEFFRGTGTDGECRSLEQILAWEDVLLELCHDYIQWLLPTDEPSRFNDDAPIIDERLQRVFQTDQVMRRNFARGVERFFKFLGISIVPDANTGKIRVAKAGNFSQRQNMCWKGPRNHNWRRISRALRSLGLVGMLEEQLALTAFLRELVAEYPEWIDGTTVAHWVREGGGAAPEVEACGGASAVLDACDVGQPESSLLSFCVLRKGVL